MNVTKQRHDPIKSGQHLFDTSQQYFDDYFSPFQKCEGDCPKDCSGGHITSLEELKGFKDCTQIFGDLFLEIKGGEFVYNK